MATAQAIRARETASAWDFFYALDMALACLISYSVITYVLTPFVDRPDALLGGMWAIVATVFVYRETRAGSLAAGVSRLAATGVSFALCLAYLMALGRRDDIVTTGITTTVVMVVAGMSPQDAWQQPLLRLADTVVGIAVGVACKWIGSFLYYRWVGEPVR